MRLMIIPCVLSLIGSNVSAEPFHGNFRCKYHGDWACAAGGTCIDTSRYAARLKNLVLTVDFDRKSADLNGISGQLLFGPTRAPQQIKWGLPALGVTTVEFHADSQVVALLHSRPDSSGNNYESVFLCETMAK